MKKINILFSIIMIAAIANAFVPPPPANQTIGLYDTQVANLVEQNCRNCHNSTFIGGISTRHHNLVSTREYGCTNCHPLVTDPIGQSVLIERNCVQCHNGTVWRSNTSGVNISRPHHINTAQAANIDCKYCHGSYVANTFDGHYVPNYNTGNITPTTHYKIYNSTSGRYLGGCYACHQNNSSATPALGDQHDTHHGAIIGNTTGIGHQRDGTPGYLCSWCHTINTSSPTGRPVGYPDKLQFEFRNSTLLQIGDTVNGTGCEKCHDAGTLHNIQVSVTEGQKGYGHIGDSWDCYGCHQFWAVGESANISALIPDLVGVNPSVLTAAEATTITLDGSGFLGSYYDAKVSIDGASMLTPSFITDNQIVVTVPALTAGVHTIQVVKTAGNITSRLSSLTVVSKVTISSAKLRAGTITIVGTGFGTKPAQNENQYVTIKKSDKRTFYSDSITSWGVSTIKAKKTTAPAAAVGDTITVTTTTGAASATITK